MVDQDLNVHTEPVGVICCRVLEAVSCGQIPRGRFENYQKIRSELTYHVQRENMGAARAERERWKNVSQKIKSMKKRWKQ